MARARDIFGCPNWVVEGVPLSSSKLKSRMLLIVLNLPGSPPVPNKEFPASIVLSFRNAAQGLRVQMGSGQGGAGWETRGTMGTVGRCDTAIWAQRWQLFSFLKRGEEFRFLTGDLYCCSPVLPWFL